MGPLPLVPTPEPTAIPSPTPTAVPTPEPTPELVSAPVQPPEPTLSTAAAPVEAPADSPLLLPGLVAAAVLLLVVVAWLVGRRKKKPAPDACAKCGYDLSGKSGACPVCGSTRRLPKMN